MAKSSNLLSSPTIDPVLKEVQLHYVIWTNDTDRRRVRENGWNDIIDAYFGKLPDNWPYMSRVVDPRIATTILEKKARLTNSKLRGRLVPREGGDVLKARLNNSLLDFQWDNASDGGSMNGKWGELDQDSRLCGSAFGLVPWRHVVDDKGKVLFEGNELYPIDPNNVGLDPNCTHIRNARWCQLREWTTIDDLEQKNDTPTGPLFPGLAQLKAKIGMHGQPKDITIATYAQDRRDTRFLSRVKQLKGIQDRMGEDLSFPVYEIVTEYRADRWITFSPRYNVILRDIENPYAHRKIPVVQLRYYQLLDDPWGESEVERVLSLWRAIQATICGFLDNMNLHMRPPIKIIEGATRIETIIWAPEAQWTVDRQDAVMEMQGSGDPLRYFQTTYSALVTAFNTAMGSASEGTGSSVDPFNPQKTATEIKYSSAQQNVRDQNNQLFLADAIQDMMSMWLSNNQQFLFLDETKHDYVLRIVGSDAFNYFKRAGLDQYEVSDPTMLLVADIIQAHNGNLNDGDLQSMLQAGETPKFPVPVNPNEKNPAKIQLKPKMVVSEMGDAADVHLIPEDLEGMYDYIPDVKSMAAGSSEEMLKAQNNALQIVTTNPTVLSLLNQEGIQPNVKELLVSILDSSGLSDAERYFTQKPAAPPAGVQQGPGAVPGMGQPGLSGVPASLAPGANGQQMAGSPQLPSAGGGQFSPPLPAGPGQGVGVPGAH